MPSPTSASVSADRPPPGPDLSAMPDGSENDLRCSTETNDRNSSLRVQSVLAPVNAEPLAHSSSSYFTQTAPSHPLVTESNSSDGPPLLTSSTSSKAVPTKGTINPPTSLPNTHFDLAIGSAAPLSTPLIPTTITQSMTLNLPGFKLPQDSAYPDAPASQEIPLQTASAKPLDLSLSEQDYFASETFSTSHRTQQSRSAASDSPFATRQDKIIEETAAEFSKFKLGLKSIKARNTDALPSLAEALPTSRHSSVFNAAAPYIPVTTTAPFNLPIQSMIQHKFRSPSLPVNSLIPTISIPDSLRSISSEELSQALNSTSKAESTLIVDVRPFNQYSQSRIRNAINICIPSTLLRRPTYNLSRFVECMIPNQRCAIANLSQYESVVIYDQHSTEISKTAYSAIAYTIIKFSLSDELKGTLYYLQGGFQNFSTIFPSLIDESEIQIQETELTSSVTEEALSSKDDLQLLSKRKKSAKPPGWSLTSAQTFNFPPVLTGFSLPASSTKDGPMKPFASNLNNSMDHTDLADEAIPIGLPSDLDQNEVKTYFPLWLQDMINPVTGPRHVARRFYDIEQAEKVRLQSAFNRGFPVTASQSPMRSPHSTTSEESEINYTFSAGVELGTKNRYSNIWPYDHTRVKLPVLNSQAQGGSSSASSAAATTPGREGTHDYFNASYITAKGTPLRYIATQGPLPDTFTDFWHVVWDKKIPVIVMLTDEYEGGIIKCHKYWNNGIYGTLSLNKTSSERVVLSPITNTIVTVRKFVLAPTAVALANSNKVTDGTAVDGEQAPISGAGQGSYYNPHLSSDSHTVIQIQYTSWPDLGSPAYPEDLIALCQIKNSYLKEWTDYLQSRSTAPLGADELRPWTVVHCSAGCGRTGTFCAVDSVIYQLVQHKKKASPAELRLPLSPFHHSAASTPPTSMLSASSKSSYQSARSDKDHELAETRDLIYRTVHDFRRQRLSMVQVLRQYTMCYETIILWVHGEYKKQQQLQAQEEEKEVGKDTSENKKEEE